MVDKHRSLIPPIGTRVRVIGGDSAAPDGAGEVIGAGFVTGGGYPVYDDIDELVPIHLSQVALVKLDHGVWSKERHFHVSVIPVHPDNLDLEVLP